MSRHDASDLAQRLGRQAEAVCRHYLSSGRREGRYWLVGDVRNTPGRSMYVRLKDSPKGPAGKWTDAATGEHGDLLDVIRESCGLIDFKDVADEARTFLSMPPPEPMPANPHPTAAPHGSPEAARRLFGMSQAITGSLVQSYLRERGITDLRGTGNLRFHPRCYYRPDEHSPTETWPAMIAAVTDLGGKITGAHRTWLDPRRRDKAPLDTPRRAMGDLLGNAVRFGTGAEVMAAGEGIETVLSVRQVLPDMPMLAALSAAHLAAILFPDTLRRLYILRDDDPAGDGARDSLVERANAAGIEAIVISPQLGDFNEDLRTLGIDALRSQARMQIGPQDVARFIGYTPGQDYIGTDTFEVIARNVSGASAPVQVSVTVAPPPPPVIQAGSLLLDFNESGEHNFAPTNGGALEVVSAPTNGGLTLTGGRARYSPAQDFIGTDSFTVLARNLGGASSPATVTVTVRPPPAPQITGGTLSLAFNASGEHNFAPTHGGALSVSAAPSHGTVSIIGGRAEYQPALDYIGSDQFAVVATNLGGVSSPATVNVTVAPPPPPAVANSSMIVAYEQAMEADLAVSGRFDSVAIVSAPQHGIVSVVGRRATYVPAQGYYGSDSFAFEASGLGGVSTPATVAVTVERPDVPVVVSDSLSAPYEAAVGFVVQVSGYYDDLVVVTEPARGALQLAGRNGTYMPHGGAYGADRFELKAIGPGGESQPVEFTVSIATPAAPTISGDDVVVGYGEAASVDLEVRGVFEEIEVASPPLKGVATLSGQTLVFTPAEGFSGVEVIGVRAVGPGGRSAILQVRVTVGAPPPPPEPDPAPPPPPVAPSEPSAPPSAPAPAIGDRAAPGLRDSVVVIDVVQALQDVVAVEIVEGPAVGDVSIALPAIRYTPPAGFTGALGIPRRRRRTKSHPGDKL